VIDLAVAGERRHGRGDETSEIKGFHVSFLRWGRWWPDRSRTLASRAPIACDAN
jgi:hypothetical protein